MKEYELTLLIDPKLTEKELEETLDQTKKYFGPETSIEKTENWGRKSLAYKLGKNNSAYFLHFLLKFKDTKLPQELSNKLKIDKKVMRHLLIRR